MQTSNNDLLHIRTSLETKITNTLLINTSTHQTPIPISISIHIQTIVAESPYVISAGPNIIFYSKV